MSPKLRHSLNWYLRVRDELVPAGKTSPLSLLNEKRERVTENTLRRRSTGG
jgi:hypothetical protein